MHARDPRGFTLIEVLVVVSIIALLVAVLIPSLSKARAQAKSVVCKSNIRQLGLGMHMYQSKYKYFPAHQWRLNDADDTRIRWFNAFNKELNGGYWNVSTCSAVDWEVGRNNSYGYNYKYLGSARENDTGPYAPYETFPIQDVKSPSRTIAFGDTDGTGWTDPYVRGINNVNMLGNHGYVLDPTYIPTRSEQTLSGGASEPYAWHNHRTYISTRHLGKSNLGFVDGHVEALRPEQVYQDNRYWNGLGYEDPQRDDHVDYKFGDGFWRFPDIPT